MKMFIQIQNVQNDSFAACCLRELKQEGIQIGDIIKGDYNKINKVVDFISPKTGADCVAWLFL